MSSNNLIIRTRAKARRYRLFVPALTLFLLVSSCKTRSEDDDTTNTFVRIDFIGTTSGATNDIFSDVCVREGTLCTVVNDSAVVTMVSFEKDDTNLPASFVNDIIFERYRVTFIRSDGRNVPGVDVPHSFDGVMNFRVPIQSGGTSASFILVRHQAKVEPPLAQLAGGGGAFVLSVLAQVDFYGRDVAGREIKVTGFLNVSFADFPE